MNASVAELWESRVVVDPEEALQVAESIAGDDVSRSARVTYEWLRKELETGVPERAQKAVQLFAHVLHMKCSAVPEVDVWQAFHNKGAAVQPQGLAGARLTAVPDIVSPAGTTAPSATAPVAAAPSIGDALTERVDAMLAELLDTDDLDSIEPLEPLIPEVLFLDTLARMNGASGHGKSFVALDMAGSVGTGKDWHGREVEAGTVLYLVAEGARGIRRRVRAWERHHGRKMTGVRFLPRPVQAADPEWLVLIELCRQLQPRLVVIDTQARVTVGVDESSNTEMGVMVDRMEQLRAASGACVLLIHHKGLNGDHGRGASAVKGAMQTELSAAKARDIVTVATDKQKDDVELGPMRFQMVPIAVAKDEAGFNVTSPVLVAVDSTVVPAQDAPVTPEEFTNDHVAALADVLRTVFAERGGTKAEVAAVVVTERRAMSRATFYRSWNRLVSNGRLVRAKGSQLWHLEGVETEAAP